ncbi:MAG TPA: carboxypeptidase-like regulatory domain-containing protein [Gemmatimonadaceae bacterium]
MSVRSRKSVTSRCTTRALVVLLAMANPVAAQVVRGTVTERGSGESLPGVLISLEPTVGGDAAARSVLSDATGAYAVRGTAGSYRLTAKRIGVQRFFSEPFTLAAGETREIGIEMEALVFVLPPVRIVDAGLCVLRDAERQRISALWDEARTALTATSLSQRDRLFQGSITRYARRLDPRTLRVLEDSWSELVGTYDRTFVSPSGDSLSKIGYWRIDPTGATYYAPDGDVLLSRAFQRDHCFTIVEGRRDRAGLIGLGFAPTATRGIPDVRGVIWMDERTFALQLVEFTYTRLPEAPNVDRVGGELRFSRLASGAWVTSRWFLRMPEYIAGTDPNAPVVMTRPTIRALIEEGGMAFGPGLNLYTNPATITGTLRDSAGAPFPGADVRLGGTPFETVTDTAGAFRLDSLPAGYFTLIVRSPSYDSLGTPMADQGLRLEEGVAARVTLRAENTAELLARMCPGVRAKRDRGIVRIQAVDSATNSPLTNMAVWLRWAGDFVGRGQNVTAGNRGGEEQRTDAQGSVVYCDVPVNMPLTVSAVNALGRPARDSIVVRAVGGRITTALLRTRRP